MATTDVVLRCPGCGYTWLAALIAHGEWWARGVTPQTIARQCYCPKCEHQPPMHVEPEAH